MGAFAIMYFGVADAVLLRRVHELFPYQRIVAIAAMVLGLALVGWSLAYFKSWRFRAALDVGHQLATGGPFAHLRHPIYAGLNLLAIGTAVWVPTVITSIGAALVVTGCSLRARAEEKLLIECFGDKYRSYKSRTRSFLPGVH
jgi:protein-S-isoprenylcysteine O-methyltransferase Ste14